MPAIGTVRQVIGDMLATLTIVGMQYAGIRVLFHTPPAPERWPASAKVAALIWLAAVSLVVVPVIQRVLGVPFWYSWALVMVILELFVAYLAYMRFPSSWGDSRIVVEVIPVFACLVLGQREVHP